MIWQFDQTYGELFGSYLKGNLILEAKNLKDYNLYVNLLYAVLWTNLIKHRWLFDDIF